MCRLLGMLLLDPSYASRYLLSDPCSLYVQSRVNPSRLQGDGWGVGFYVNGALRIVKSWKPVYEELERFKATMENINSSIVIAHVRRASNPRKLPKEKLISVENSQPFGYRNYLFAHNGVITIPDEAANLLGGWQSNIRGLNDSEIYFWYIIKELSEGRSIPEALKNFQRDLSRVWRETCEKYPDKDEPYIGLNIIFSDGNKLYAYCKYDEAKYRQARSLCYGDQPAMQMTFLADSEKLIVASEKTNGEENWQPLKSRHLLVSQIIDGRVKFHIQEC